MHRSIVFVQVPAFSIAVERACRPGLIGRPLVVAPPDSARALVQVGEVEVVLQSDRRPFTRLSHFETMGIDIHRKKLIVVKLGYLFPELRDLAPYHIMALSPGFGDQRIERLPYQGLHRPIYPLDPDVEWRAKARE